MHRIRDITVGESQRIGEITVAVIYGYGSQLAHGSIRYAAVVLYRLSLIVPFCQGQIFAYGSKLRNLVSRVQSGSISLEECFLHQSVLTGIVGREEGGTLVAAVRYSDAVILSPCRAVDFFLPVSISRFYFAFAVQISGKHRSGTVAIERMTGRDAAVLAGSPVSLTPLLGVEHIK